MGEHTGCKGRTYRLQRANTWVRPYGARDEKSFHPNLHSSQKPHPRREEREQEIVGYQTREQAFFAQMLGGVMVDNELGAKAQQEEKDQNRDIENRAFSDGECRFEEHKGDEGNIKQELRAIEKAQQGS